MYVYVYVFLLSASVLPSAGQVHKIICSLGLLLILECSSLIISFDMK